MKKKLLVFLGSFIICFYFIYLFLLPVLVSNRTVQFFLCKKISAVTNSEIKLESLKLKTSVKPSIALDIGLMTVNTSAGAELVRLENFDVAVSFAKFYKKTIVLKRLVADNLIVDVDKILELLPQKENVSTQSKSFPAFNVDVLNLLFYVKNCRVLASLNSDTKLLFQGNDLRIDDKRNPKYVKFNINLELQKLGDVLKISLEDNDKFYIKDKKLIIEECPLTLNDSRMQLRSVASKDKFIVSLASENFNIVDAAALLGSNIFIANGKEFLAETPDIKGVADFNFVMDKSGLSGEVDIKSATFKLKSLAYMPVTIHTGRIRIAPNLINLEGFKGFYGNSPQNVLSMSGMVKDYLKSVDTKIVVSTRMTDDFARNYLSKVVGVLITMTGDKSVGAKVEITSKYSDVDIVCMAKLPSGSDILLEGASLSPETFDRAIKADMHLRKNILNIESINYYVAKELNKDSKVEPILKLQGNVDIADNSKILDFGFSVPKPLPSEFLNVVLGRPMFKKGTIAGNLEYTHKGKFPQLNGELIAQKVVIPSQRLFIRNCSLKTDNNYLELSSDGKFRRSEYKLSGKILNNLLFPIIVKNLDLDLEYIDIEKLLSSLLVSQEVSISESAAQAEFLESAEDGAKDDASDVASLTFVPNLLVIERAAFNLASGKYKEILLGNLQATASLDKNGKLNIDSNLFDFAEGKSTAKVRCDLAKPHFWVRLGAKDINSDIIATALLNLKREISGLAKGLIILETDSSLALNGEMKFEINDGTIEKVGLVEYALNFVSLFRNPVAMLSPSLLFDIVNIPEGKFDKIYGELLIADNIIKKIKIESTSPQLATLIVGRFDLLARDASLRIYTKFATKRKGFTGFLRKLSLNSLANSIPLGISSSAENYYSAELEMLPAIDADEKDCQVFLTTVDGDIERNNFLSSLKKIK